jgi:hypothetical protein
MTDGDPPRRFLERWSRQKIDSAREAPDAAGAPRATDAALPDQPGSPARAVETGAKAPAEAAKPEFDLSSLPPLDSITAVTDVRAFLSPGVPKALARAALRRAWAADPAIRDFKGLAENDWDFTDPAAMPGFGALPEGTDMMKMVMKLFSGSEKPAEPASDQPSASPMPSIARENVSSAYGDDSTPLPPTAETPSSPEIPRQEKSGGEDTIVQRHNNIASHKSISGNETEEPKKRGQHGGALPQ